MPTLDQQPKPLAPELLRELRDELIRLLNSGGILAHKFNLDNDEQAFAVKLSWQEHTYLVHFQYTNAGSGTLPLTVIKAALIDVPTSDQHPEV